MIEAELALTMALWKLSLGYGIGFIFGKLFVLWLQRRARRG